MTTLTAVNGTAHTAMASTVGRRSRQTGWKLHIRQKC